MCSHLSGLKTICHSLSDSSRCLRSVCSDAVSCWSRMTLYSRQSLAKSHTEEDPPPPSHYHHHRFEQRCHESSFPVIRNLALFVGSLIYECQCGCDWRGNLLQESWWDLVRTTSFVRLLAKKQLLHSIYLYVERWRRIYCVVSHSRYWSAVFFGEGTNKLVIQDLDLVSGFRIVDAIFLQWGNTGAVTLHIIDVGKELLVVGDWLTYHVADVVIMGSLTCLLGFFLNLLVAMSVRLFFW